MSFHARTYLCSLFVYLLLSVAGATPIVLRDPTQTYDLFRSSSLLEVRPGQVSIQDLLQTPGRYTFVPTRNALIKPQEQQRAYWFRVDLTRQSADAFILHFDYCGTERMTIYEVADGRVVASRQIGTLVRESANPFRYSNWFWPMQLPEGQPRTVYVYMEGIHTTALYFGAETATTLLGTIHSDDLFNGIYYGFILIVILYSLFLYTRLGERDTLFYAIWVLFIGLQLALYRGFVTEFLWASDPSLSRYGSVIGGLTGILHILFTVEFLRLRQLSPRFYRVGLFVAGLYLIGIVLLASTIATRGQLGSPTDLIPVLALIEGLFSVGAGVFALRHGFRPALFYSIGNLIFFLSIFQFLSYAFGYLPPTFWARNSLYIGSGIEIILSALALTYKVNLLKEKEDEAISEQLRLADENRRLVERQNAELEFRVQERTTEINAREDDLQVALASLRQTQEQLVQQEKLASLGELTASIAHEIQNPLNFVNNFAEVSVELVDELNDGLQTGDTDTVSTLSSDIRTNLAYIVQNGQRASDIVRNMLQHARAETGQLELTDLNTLADEYLRLSYQGIRTKDRSFTAQLQTDYDPALPPVLIVPQDIGRVLLNLLNNAFYAVQQKARLAENGFIPTIAVCTRHTATYVRLTIRDNGPGIPPAVQDKIFQPFFTTKPTGQGTGLGLSISYDIITNGHGGQLSVDSQPDVYTEFSLQIPLPVS
ncbi:sensor histidine kinase [Spirosoma rhododendri]|uniref:histidine kinase n=1 Tax=Spirosoma rhododendri TaxID=2728024 RepID=A0A7L5DGS9_9BACT|nr:7TM diverse intracellular signaling domain-containing protein [Spirosoma rhododendri]QJD77165.1 hypothetical protein HH216_01080 [Spirosoma rhododendri]